MFFGIFGNGRKNGRKKSSRATVARDRRPVRLCLESLEQRLLPSVTQPIEVAEFQGAGVWRYTNSWTQIDGTDASLVATDAAGDVAASFKGAGVWTYSAAAAGWTQIDQTDATLLTVAANGDVVAGFKGAGVWTYAAGSWTQIDGTDASLLATDATGGVVAGFKGAGVWTYAAGAWTQIDHTDAALLATDSAGDVVGGFQGAGVWTYTAAAGWTQINQTGATVLATAAKKKASGLTATITGLPPSGHSPEGTQLMLGATVSGGASGTDTYSWTVTQSGATAATGSSASLVFTPATAGTYQVALTVTDSAKHTAAASGSVVVDDLAPTVALGGPYSGKPGSAITFTASPNQPNPAEAVKPFTYSWSFGDGATDSGTSATDSHSYAVAGSYTLKVTVTDSDGESASATAIVSVGSGTLQTVVLDGTSYTLVNTPVAFSVSNPNQPPAGGFTYSWNFGDGSTDVTSSPMDSHAYAAIGTYTATVTVTNAFGDQAGSSAPVTINNNASDPLFTPVVNQSSFSYIGSFALPTYAVGWDTAYSSGGLAYRYVNGNIQFFTTAHQYSGGLVYEFNNPGLSTDQSNLPRAQVVNNWGDIYTGQKLDDNYGGYTSLSSADPTNGLYYDPASNRLYWTYGDWYNAQFPYQQSIGYSTLNDATVTATGAGAWSLTNRPEKFDRGGVLQIPQWFANRYTGGDTLGVGFGGYYSIVASASFGPALAAIAPPNPAVNPDDSSLANVPLLGYPSNAPDRAHRDTSYTSYYDGGVYPTTPGGWNPANGAGYWTWSDTIGGAAWIDTPQMQGVLYVGQVGQGNVYYQNSDRHAQSNSFEWFVYNPADLAAVASGAKQQWQIQPEYEWTTPALPSGAAATNVSVGGVTFDPTTNRLYVLMEGATGWNGSEAWPEMYVFQVGAPAKPTTPGSPLVVTDAQAGFSETGAGWTAAPNGYMGEGMQVTSAAPGAATATWKASGLADGWYALSVDWNAAPNGNTTAAVYQIYDGSKLVQTVTVDQTKTPTGQVRGGPLFQQLAKVNITSGSLTVVASSQAAGNLAADALCVDPSSNPL